MKKTLLLLAALLALGAGCGKDKTPETTTQPQTQNTSAEQPETLPTQDDKILTLLLALKSKSSVTLSEPKSQEFEWYIGKGDLLFINGKRVEATAVNDAQVKELSSLLVQQGLAADTSQNADGALGGNEGFSKDEVGCVLSKRVNTPSSTISSSAYDVTIDCGIVVK